MSESTVARTAEAMALPDEKESCGNGSIDGYRVQARYMYHEPKIIHGMALDERWRYIDFPQSHVGVPRGPDYYTPMLQAAYCYSYQSAQALRWWFHAEAEREMLGGLCIDTRLVKFTIEYSHKWKPVSCHGLIGGDDRSSSIPDWGKKS